MSYTNGLDNPELYFQTKLYTGNGTSQSITLDGSENMQPDWVWIKERSSTSDHSLHDSVRGSTKIVKSSTNAAEITRTGSITSFDSDGFSLGDNAGVNENSQTYASWNWLAGGSASSNSNGSITSSVSANTTAGFSIVSYTGTGSTATIGHGLSSTPQVVLIKCRSDATNWHMYHSSVTTADNQVMYLDLNYALSTLTTSSFDVSEFSASVFGLNTNDAVNGSGRTYIAYCFAEKKVYSKFGSFTGNGSSDGSYIHLGFKPAWVMIKRTGGVQDWIILDNKRPEYNETNRALYANANYDDAGTDKGIDILSNGFKLRKNHAAINYSENYIYMAFAESPFVNSNGVPNNAR
jgi:hypothetical protein